MPRTSNLRLLDRLILVRANTTEYPKTPPVIHDDQLDRTPICAQCGTEAFTILNSNELPHVWAVSACSAPVIAAWEKGEMTHESRLTVGDWNEAEAARWGGDHA